MSPVQVTYSTLRAQELELLVVIVCYKAAALAIDCLRSLAPQVAPWPGVKVAVCENGTGDEALTALRDAVAREGWSEWVMLKAIRPNRGFTGGNNAVLDEVMRWPTPPRFCLLLNADTVVRRDALRLMLDAMRSAPEVGILGPRLISPDGQTQMSSFLDPSPLSEFLRGAQTGAINRLFGRAASPLQPRRPRGDFGWLSFACAMIRCEVLQQVGLLDEGYFLYYDDPDHCRRTRLAGWRLRVCPEAQVVHLEGASNTVPSDTKARRRRPRYFYESRARYFAKHRGIASLWLGNLAWHLGRFIGAPRELLTGKPRTACQGEWRDIWINCLRPVRPPTEPIHRPTAKT